VAPNQPFSYGTGNENHEFGTGLLCIRESYQQLRGLILLVIGCHKGRWCHIIVLPTVGKIDDVDSYEKLERVFDKFPE
jgi:hypothetical protein